MRVEFKVKNWRYPSNKWIWVYPDGNRSFPGYPGDWSLDWKESFEEAFVSYKTFKKEHPLLASLKRFPRNCLDVKCLLDWWQKADEEKQKSFMCINNVYNLGIERTIAYADHSVIWLGIKSDDHAGLGAWLSERYRLWECVDNSEEMKKCFDFAKFARLNEPDDIRVCNLFDEFYVLLEDAAESLYKGDSVFN